MLEKVQKINELLDTYEELLTEKQIDILSLYYREDLSYQEIADNLKITKSAVYDTIKTGENLLLKYEDKIKAVNSDHHVNQFLEKLEQLEIEKVDRLVEQFKKER